MNAKKIATMGVLIALSIVLVLLIHFPIFPAAPFLEYDPADIPIFITTFMFGPVSGFVVTLIAAVLQGLTVSAGSGLYGIIMHTVATGTFVLVAGNIYKRNKTRKQAAVSLVCGVVAWVLIMVAANLVITPLYGTNIEIVKAIMVPVIIPFNLIKAGINALVTFLIYKSISRLVHQLTE